jgi:hypothetical protein
MKRSQLYITTIFASILLVVSSCKFKSQEDIKKIESWDLLFGKKELAPSLTNRPIQYSYIESCIEEYRRLYKDPKSNYDSIAKAYTESIGFSNTATDPAGNLGIPLAKWIVEHSDTTIYSEIRIYFGVYVKPKDTDHLDSVVINHILNDKRKNGNPILGSLTVFFVATKKTDEAGGVKGGPDTIGFNIGDMFP